MKNKQAFFVNQMWNPFMLVELNIINGELPKYPINDSPPKKNIGRVSHMLIMRTLFIYFKKYIEPTQHINKPECPIGRQARKLKNWKLGEGEE